MVDWKKKKADEMIVRSIELWKGVLGGYFDTNRIRPRPLKNRITSSKEPSHEPPKNRWPNDKISGWKPKSDGNALVVRFYPVASAWLCAFNSSTTLVAITMRWHTGT